MSHEDSCIDPRCPVCNGHMAEDWETLYINAKARAEAAEADLEKAFKRIIIADVRVVEAEAKLARCEKALREIGRAADRGPTPLDKEPETTLVATLEYIEDRAREALEGRDERR